MRKTWVVLDVYISESKPNHSRTTLCLSASRSVVYEWQGGNLVQVQQISSQGATDIQAFTVGSNAYLAIANSRNNGKISD